MPPSTKRLLLTCAIAAYTVIASLLIAVAIDHEDALRYSSYAYGRYYDMAADVNLPKLFLILLVVYAIRSAALLLPVYARNPKWRSVFAWGIGVTPIAEALILLIALYLTSLTPTQCPGSGPFSTCIFNGRWLLPLIAVSTAIQAVTMLTAFIAARSKDSHESV